MRAQLPHTALMLPWGRHCGLPSLLYLLPFLWFTLFLLPQFPFFHSFLSFSSLLFSLSLYSDSPSTSLPKFSFSLSPSFSPSCLYFFSLSPCSLIHPLSHSPIHFLYLLSLLLVSPSFFSLPFLWLTVPLLTQVPLLSVPFFLSFLSHLLSLFSASPSFSFPNFLSFSPFSPSPLSFFFVSLSLFFP